MSPSIAVVGAGIAGLSCARALARAGAAVTVFEAAGAPGGRAGAHQTEIGSFDHGAQYFTVRDPAFADAVHAWESEGIVAPWHGRIAAMADGGRAILKSDQPLRYVGVPSMAALATHLARGVDVRLEERICRIERLETGGWTLQHVADPALRAGPGHIEITEGLYDALALALPAPLAADLLEGAPELAALARRVRIEPCWTLMLGFGAPLDLPYDGAFVEGGRLAWIAHDSSKPGRRSGERWIAQAPPAWSREHFDDNPDDVRVKLWKAFTELTGTSLQPVYTALERWAHALPEAPLSSGCLWSREQRLGVCGDWCAGARLEGAWLSGRALAQRMAQSVADG